MSSEASGVPLKLFPEVGEQDPGSTPELAVVEMEKLRLGSPRRRNAGAEEQ